MWTNYHTHTNYCDGKASITEVVASALTQNVVSLGFSSHAPIPIDCKWCMKRSSLENYLDEIETQKAISSSPQIYSSLEIDYIPGVISPKEFESRLDYTIGSVHYVDFFKDERAWEIDGTHAFFLEGYTTIFKKDIRAVVTRYFELTREMVTDFCPTIVGHMDRIKIQNQGESFFKESDPWYQDQVKQTLEAIWKSGAIVEVNTKGLYQKKLLTTYPSPWILELILKRGIPITLSSDAHHPDNLVNQFPEVASSLRSIGFEKIKVLEKGDWMDASFDHMGVHL
ncbi:MAG: histidinol-phosphatase [Bacteroidota bacterium]